MWSNRTAISALVAVLVAISSAGCGLVAELSEDESTTVETPVSPSPTPKPTKTIEPIVDSGARYGANGAATPNDDGSVTYVVADGDVGGVVCDRFGLSWSQLQYEDGRGGINCYAFLYPDDVLNLSSARNGVEPK